MQRTTLTPTVTFLGATLMSHNVTTQICLKNCSLMEFPNKAAHINVNKLVNRQCIMPIMRYSFFLFTPRTVSFSAVA